MIEQAKCIMCKHYLGKLRCKAFLKLIPEKIAIGKEEHNQIIEGQTGNYIFEKKGE